MNLSFSTRSFNVFWDGRQSLHVTVGGLEVLDGCNPLVDKVLLSVLHRLFRLVGRIQEQTKCVRVLCLDGSNVARVDEPGKDRLDGMAIGCFIVVFNLRMF